MRLALTSLALLVGGAEAVFMPAIFKDGMVLQTPADGGRPASIFGYANPSEMVAVNMTINTANGPSLTQYSTTADSSTGKWSVVVAPTGDDLTPSNVTFAIQGASDVQPSFIYNATFGEVILCNGQSNMVLSVAGASNMDGRSEYPSAPLQNFTWPYIRLFSVVSMNSSSPTRDLPEYINASASSCSWGRVPNSVPMKLVCQTWQTAVPGVTDYFSAECFHTAHYMIQNGAIPANRTVGLIQSAYSGTAMETWIPPEALNGCPVNVTSTTRPTRTVASAAGAVTSTGSSSETGLDTWVLPTEPFCLWNDMIYPIVGYGLRAVLHNQIEANSEDDFEYFSCVFQNMIAAWRERWGIGDFPFVATQLGDQGFSPDDGGKTFDWPTYASWPRDGQLSIIPGRYGDGISRTPAGGLVTTYDRGDRVANPFGVWDVHSRFKQEVGRRMALVVQNLTGLNGGVADWEGPVPAAATMVDTSGNGTIMIVWGTPTAPAPVATPSVYINGTQDCWECCDGSKSLDSFQVSWYVPGTNFTNATKQGWVNCSFVYDPKFGTITLTPIEAPQPKRPYAVVRYAASMWPQCAVYSRSNDVPAYSFSDLEIYYPPPAAAATSASGVAGSG